MNTNFKFKISNIKQKQGFTIIEIIIYLALFTIVIGGGMVAAYQIVESTNATQNHVVLQEEANFLLRKINWAITGATAVSANGATLTASKPINGVSTQLVLTLNANNITLQRDSELAVTLNSSSVIVNTISFVKEAGTNGKPDSVVTSFTLTTLQHGRSASQSFSTTKYLRK